MALMCFSTVARWRCNVSAIASLVLPWAINPSTSRSRSVSRCSGDERALAWRETNPSTTSGSITERPATTSLRARAIAPSSSPMRSLRR